MLIRKLLDTVCFGGTYLDPVLWDVWRVTVKKLHRRSRKTELFAGELVSKLSVFLLYRYDLALSREQKNQQGGKMYIQDKVAEYGNEVFDLLDKGAHIYFCGLKGMMPGIQDTLKNIAESRGESWEEKLAALKKNKQWHVEVY
jgi:sulfite reductase alpha subunit-like flavoprotein